MGNQQSASTVQNINTNYDTFVKYIDTIAAEYITGSTFSSLKNLANPEQCNRLVIITADLFNKRLSAREVQHLYRRRTGVLEQGDYKDDFTKNKLVYFRKDDTDKLNVQDARLKRNMCIGISRFYVQVAHLFAAIMNTVKVWSPNDGTAGVAAKGTLSFCDSQTYGLFTKQTDPRAQAQSANELFNLPPNATAVSIDSGVCSTLKSGDRLSNIPAFKTLDALYANLFEYTGNNAGRFIGMTDEMRKKVYINDVRAFYGMLHGINASDVPPHVVSFQDIPLPDIQTCRENRLKSGRFDLTGNNGENYKLYREYANHIMKMMLQSKNDRAALISLLNEVFVVEPMTDAELEKEQERLRSSSSYLFSGDGSSSSRRENKYKIYIHPELTETKLQNIVNAARVMIVKIYTNCQSNFLKGLQLLEAISAQIQAQDLRGRRDAAYTTEQRGRSGELYNNNNNDTADYNNNTDYNNNERRGNVRFEEPPQRPYQRQRYSEEQEQEQQQHQINDEKYKQYDIKRYSELMNTLNEMKIEIRDKNLNNSDELNNIIDKEVEKIINKGYELINDRRSRNTINITFDTLNRDLLTTKEIISRMMTKRQ
jgi:hypothetical protein